MEGYPGCERSEPGILELKYLKCKGCSDSDSGLQSWFSLLLGITLAKEI